MQNSVASCPQAHSSLRADPTPVSGLRNDSCLVTKITKASREVSGGGVARLVDLLFPIHAFVGLLQGIAQRTRMGGGRPK